MRIVRSMPAALPLAYFLQPFLHMVAILTILIVLIFSLLIARIATVALTLTGLSRESARFQARSAFTGVGFTTGEAERVVNHPVRRRILMLLMLLGNAGIVTAIASLVLTFVGVNSTSNWLWRFVFLALGLSILWFVATSRWIDRRLTPLISWALKRWSDIDVRDYARVLHLAGDYGVIELQVEEQDWLAERTLAELDLPHEGILVLGIQRQNGDYIGAPKGQARIKAGDTVIMYGRSPVLADLDERRSDWSGDVAHQRSIAEQRQVLQQQEEADQKNQTGKNAETTSTEGRKQE